MTLFLQLCVLVSAVGATLGIGLYKFMGTADEAYDRMDDEEGFYESHRH